MEFTVLKGYPPQKPTNDFEALKGTFRCMVNHARLENYTGEKPEFEGRKFFRYELEICDDPAFSGRRLWKSVDMMDESTNKQGKTRAMQLADTMFALGLELGETEDSINACAEAFVKMILKVTARHFKGSEGDTVQVHTIKGLADEKADASSEAVPF